MLNASLRILILSGSVRAGSHTRALAGAVQTRLVDLGCTVSTWDPRTRPLPVADPRFHDDPVANPDPAVRELVALADAAHGFVLASPVYHNSYSGVLKNTLDHLSIKQFYMKPVGLMGHGGRRSTQPVDHLRIVVRGLLGVAIPSQVCTEKGDYGTCGDRWTVADPGIVQRIDRFCIELVAFAHPMVEAEQ